MNANMVRVYTVDSFSSFTPVSRKTKNETVLRFSNYRFLHEMRYMASEPISAFLTLCGMRKTVQFSVFFIYAHI